MLHINLNSFNILDTIFINHLNDSFIHNVILYMKTFVNMTEFGELKN